MTQEGQHYDNARERSKHYQHGRQERKKTDHQEYLDQGVVYFTEVYCMRRGRSCKNKQKKESTRYRTFGKTVLCGSFTI